MFVYLQKQLLQYLKEINDSFYCYDRVFVLVYMTLILREMGNNVFSLFLQENLFIKSSTSVNNLFAPLETMPDNKFKKTILQKTKRIDFL
jgi:hypothetical protein